jgi:hypothetical protein
MIEFFNEETRTAFHLLPIDTQKDWESQAERLLSRGFVLKFYFIEQEPNGPLEISIRIDKKFDHPTG